MAKPSPELMRALDALMERRAEQLVRSGELEAVEEMFRGSRSREVVLMGSIQAALDKLEESCKGGLTGKDYKYPSGPLALEALEILRKAINGEG